MRSVRRAGLLVALCFSPLTTGSLPAQQRVGTVVEKTRELTATPLPDGPSKSLGVLDPIHLETRLETGILSSARLLFGEEQTLKMGSRAAVVVSRHLPQAEGGLLTQLSGSIRYYIATGASGIPVETSETTIIRSGTVFVVRAENRRTTVWVIEGRVEVQPKGGGAGVKLGAGEMTVVRRGRAPTAPAPFDPRSGATGSGALPPPFDRPPEEHFDPPIFPVPPELPPRRGVDPSPIDGPP